MGFTEKLRNAAKGKGSPPAKKAAKAKPKKAPRKAAAKKAAKPKAKPKKASKPPSKPKKAATKPKAKKAAVKKAPNAKGAHPNPQKFDGSPRLFSEIFLADLVREAAASMGVAHAELARRLECSGPRIPEILRSENLTEALASRCFQALGVDLKIVLVKTEG
jgi:hypothetical protein